jgi:hypothetical protein
LGYNGNGVWNQLEFSIDYTNHTPIPRCLVVSFGLVGFPTSATKSQTSLAEESKNHLRIHQEFWGRLDVFLVRKNWGYTVPASQPNDLFADLRVCHDSYFLMDDVNE